MLKKTSLLLLLPFFLFDSIGLSLETAKLKPISKYTLQKTLFSEATNSDETNSDELILTGSTLWSEARKIKKRGSNIFVLYNTGLQILEKNGDTFSEIARVCLEEGSFAYTSYAVLEIMGNRVVAQLGTNIYLINIEDPDHPYAYPKLSIDMDSNQICMVNNYIYVSYWQGFKIIKINSSSLEYIKSIKPENMWRTVIGVRGNNLYVGGSGLYIYDITVPDSPLEKAFIPNPEEFELTFNDFTIIGNYMYLDQYYEQFPQDPVIVKIAIMELDQGLIPNIIFHQQFSGIAASFQVLNDRLFIEDPTCGIRVFDIADPSNPTPILNYRHSGYTMSASIDNNSLLYFLIYKREFNTPCERWIENVPLITNDQEFKRGFFFDDIEDLTEPKTIASKSLPDEIAGVNVDGNTAFAFSKGDIYAVDVSDESYPEVISFIGTPGYANSSRIKGDQLIVADGEKGLSFFDFSNPASPEFLASCSTEDQALDVLISGNIAYVADNTAGLKIMDISTPGNCQILSSMVYNYAKNLTLTDNNILFLAGGDKMELIDVSVPSNPDFLSSVLATYAGSTTVSYGAYDGTYAYAAHESTGTTSIYDISNPKNPLLKSTFQRTKLLSGILAVNDRIFLPSHERPYIYIMDKTDISSPIPSGFYKTQGLPRGIDKNESNIFLADNSSLMVFKKDIITSAETQNNTPLPKNFSLAQNYPNPFNPNTTIEFSVPRSSNIRIEVLNILGQKIRTLLNKNINAGTHSVTWDGKNSSGKLVASGTYLYKMDTAKFTQTKKMILLK